MAKKENVLGSGGYIKFHSDVPEYLGKQYESGKTYFISNERGEYDRWVRRGHEVVTKDQFEKSKKTPLKSSPVPSVQKDLEETANKEDNKNSENQEPVGNGFEEL